MEFENRQLQSQGAVWKTLMPHVGKRCDSPGFDLTRIPECAWQFRLEGYWDESIRDQAWKIYLLKIPKSYRPTTATFGFNVVFAVCASSSSITTGGSKDTRSGEFQLGISINVKNTSDNLIRVFGGQININRQDTYIFRLTRKQLSEEIGIKGETISMFFFFDLDKQTENIFKQTGETSCLQSFSKDIVNLFDNEKHADAVLKCGDQKFWVNKRMLSASSEVFAAMFQHKMTENESGVINVADVEPSIMDQFLRYVYSGRVDALCMDSVFDLYKAADKYAVNSLKEKCTSFIADNLSEENVCEFLLMSHTFGFVELFNTVLAFVVRKGEFLKSEQFYSFAKQNPTVGVEVFIKFHAK